MGNAAGGLLIYGVSEKELPDGRRLPGGPTPIRDGGIAAQLEDVLYSSVSPQLNLSTGFVPASAGGYFLLVRVQPRSGPLHMVEGHGQHRYFLRAGLATRPMEAHEVESAFRDLALGASRVEREAAQLPLVPRIAETRARHLESGAIEPGERPWVSVVTAPLDPGAKLEMRTPSRQDFPVVDLHARYRRDHYYLSDGSYTWDATGYVSRADEEGVLLRVLRLYRNGWCEWGYRYLRPPDDPDGNPWDRATRKHSRRHHLYRPNVRGSRLFWSPPRMGAYRQSRQELPLAGARLSGTRSSDNDVSFEADTNVEHLLSRPLAVVHAAMDRLWQGYGLPRCTDFAPDGQLLRSSR